MISNYLKHLTTAFEYLDYPKEFLRYAKQINLNLGRNNVQLKDNAALVFQESRIILRWASLLAESN